MAGRHFQLSTGSLFLTWLIAAVVILLLPSGVTDRGHLVFHRLFRPILESQHDLQLDVTGPGETAAGITQAQYNTLKKDFSDLHAQLLALHDEYEQVTRIRSGLPVIFKDALVPARVTGSGDSLSHEIIIDKGTDAAIAVGNYVLSAGKNSIVGIVAETGLHLSRVLLLTDARQKIAVQIQRPGETTDNIPGLMVGSGKLACTISNIETGRDVRVGDSVLGRSHPGLLNVPLVVGEVAAVRPDDKHPLLWDITVRPVDDLTRLDNVAVIIIEDF